MDTIVSLHLANSLGCYRDTARRAIPQMDGRNSLVKGYYRRRADAILKCALVALRFGYRVFAVQHQGWCATGRRAHVTYRKYGRSNRCRNGKGGPWANDVYKIAGEFKDIVVASFGSFRKVTQFLSSITYGQYLVSSVRKSTSILTSSFNDVERMVFKKVATLKVASWT